MKNVVKKRSVILVFLFLMHMVMSSCSHEDTTTNDTNEMCVTGSINIIDHEELGKYIFIGGLIMPKGYDKYKDIKVVVVPKDDFPLQNYQTGDIISFKIIEVLYPFPPFDTPLFPASSSAYLCSITLVNHGGSCNYFKINY